MRSSISAEADRSGVLGEPARFDFAPEASVVEDRLDVERVFAGMMDCAE